MTSCSLVWRQHFRGTCCLHLQAVVGQAMWVQIQKNMETPPSFCQTARRNRQQDELIYCSALLFYPEDRGDIFLRNVGLPPIYKVLQPGDRTLLILRTSRTTETCRDDQMIVSVRYWARCVPNYWSVNDKAMYAVRFPVAAHEVDTSRPVRIEDSDTDTA
jgi:hypothetical protein